MSFLLDTNVISELVKSQPNPYVVDWINSVDNTTLYITVLTLGEIRKGIAKIDDKISHEKISKWLEYELPDYFSERILIIDAKVADKWGQLQSNNNGYTLPVIDGLIAATALVHDLKLVTRNTKDFINTSVQLINPWES